MAKVIQSGQSVRELIRDLMTKGYRNNDKVNWTVGEIVIGLEADGYAGIDRVKTSNGLQSLRNANKAEQTDPIPGAPGGARYWALTKVLELATAPKHEQNESETMSDVSDAIANLADEPVSSPRKPRHDSDEHLISEVGKHVGAIADNLERKVSVLLADFEKRMKSAQENGQSAESFNTLSLTVTGAVNQATSAASATPLRLMRELSAEIQRGLKLNADDQLRIVQELLSINEVLFGRVDQLGEATGDMFDELSKAQEISKESFSEGFSAGFAEGMKYQSNVGASSVSTGKSAPAEKMNPVQAARQARPELKSLDEIKAQLGNPVKTQGQMGN